MLAFAIQYRKAIDKITEEKSSKLRKFELDQEEWEIVKDLHFVLEVFWAFLPHTNISNILQFNRNTRMLRCLSHVQQPLPIPLSPLWTSLYSRLMQMVSSISCMHLYALLCPSLIGRFLTTRTLQRRLSFLVFQWVWLLILLALSAPY